jgi:hypothetical protein
MPDLSLPPCIYSVQSIDALLWKNTFYTTIRPYDHTESKYYVQENYTNDDISEHLLSFYEKNKRLHSETSSKTHLCAEPAVQKRRL